MSHIKALAAFSAFFLLAACGKKVDDPVRMPKNVLDHAIESCANFGGIIQLSGSWYNAEVYRYAAYCEDRREVIFYMQRKQL